jgi:hypothetical protein
MVLGIGSNHDAGGFGLPKTWGSEAIVGSSCDRSLIPTISTHIDPRHLSFKYSLISKSSCILLSQFLHHITIVLGLQPLALRRFEPRSPVIPGHPNLFAITHCDQDSRPEYHDYNPSRGLLCLWGCDRSWAVSVLRVGIQGWDGWWV